MNSTLSRIGSQHAINSSNNWLVRLVTLIIWMLTLICVVYWGVKFTKLKAISAIPTAIVPAKAVETQTVAKLLGTNGAIGSNPRSMVANANFVLHGVANTNTGGGIALIAVDGKPAKPYPVGSQLTELWKLKTLSRTGVVLVGSKSNAEEMSLILQPRQPTTGIVVNANSAVANTTNNPRIPLPQRNNVAVPNNSIPALQNQSAINSGAAASSSGLNSTQAARAVSKYATQESTTTPVGSVVQVEELNTSNTINRTLSSTTADTTNLK